MIGGLTPGTNYTVSVAACSSECSSLVNSTSNTGMSDKKNYSGVSVSLIADYVTFYKSYPEDFSIFNCSRHYVFDASSWLLYILLLGSLVLGAI